MNSVRSRGVEALRIDATEALAGVREVVGSGGFPEPLEIRARGDQIGAVGEGWRDTSRLLGGVDRRVELRAGCRTRVPRDAGRAGRRRAGGRQPPAQRRASPERAREPSPDGSMPETVALTHWPCMAFRLPSFTPLVQCRPMVEPRIVPARRAPDLAPRHRSRRAEGPLPPAAGRSRRLSRRRQRPRSAARPPAEGFRHRHVGASLSGQEAVSQLLDHRPPLPSGARQVRHEGDRGRDVPAAGRAGRRSRAGRRARAGSEHARRASS